MASSDQRATRLQFASLTGTNADDGYMSPPGPSGTVWRLDGAYLDPQAATTADASNNAVVTLKKGSTSLGAYTSDVAGGSLAAGTPKAITLTGTGTDLEFTAGTHTLLAAVTKGGTGVTIEIGVTAIWTQVR